MGAQVTSRVGTRAGSRGRKKKETVDKMPAHSGCKERKPARKYTEEGIKRKEKRNRAGNKAIENKGKEKDERAGKKQPRKQGEKPAEASNVMRILQGGAWTWAMSMAPPRSGPSPPGHRYPPTPRSLWGKTAGPPPASPAQRALIGQSPGAREAGHAHPPLLLHQGRGPEPQRFLKCSEPPQALHPLLPHHPESCPSGTACSYYNKHLSRNLSLICILAALILMKYANVYK